MKQELERFVKIISGIAIGIGVVFFIIAVIVGSSFEFFPRLIFFLPSFFSVPLSGYDALTAAVFTIGIIVANVPEGLLATVTVALAITAQRMHSKNVLVKSTETVETLGSINAIASDKTGTLTQNRMTVRHAIFNSSQVRKLPRGRENSLPEFPFESKLDQERRSVDDLDAVTHAINQEVTSALSEELQTSLQNQTNHHDRGSWSLGTHPINRGTNRVRNSNQELIDLIRCAGLCNHSTFELGQESKPILQRVTTSDPSEGALLKFAHSHYSIYSLREQHPEVACIPFSSVTKWMLTIHREKASGGGGGGGGGFRFIMKGAPERVLERCSSHGTGTSHELLTKDILADIEEANAEVAENGERVLAFAEYLMPDLPHDYQFVTDEADGINFPITGYRFVGMLSLEDPPREEVPKAVTSCHEAGIQVIMVTGDHPLTARSIAGQVNILQPNDENELAPLYDTKRPQHLRCDPMKDCVVVTGSELDSFTQEDWDYVLTRRDIVFARTLPHQKQQIVAMLQEKDLVVAVTGDGVNDAPGDHPLHTPTDFPSLCLSPLSVSFPLSLSLSLSLSHTLSTQESRCRYRNGYRLTGGTRCC
jgi:sodium/potassium-transporting ATPase subunit alpha